MHLLNMVAVALASPEVKRGIGGIKLKLTAFFPEIPYKHGRSWLSLY